MVRAGIIGPDEEVELIGGEIVPMSAKGNRHERVRRMLVVWIYKRIRDDLHLLVEPGWRPHELDYLEPDLLIVPATHPDLDVPAAEARLAIEIADFSLPKDTSLKRDRYATLGVPEYWVIEAWPLMTRVYRDPVGGAYGPPLLVPPTEMLLPRLVPEVAVRLADLAL